jgi:hypothetical protein
MAPSEPLALMKKLPYFNDLIEFDNLLVGLICLGIHDSIKYHLFNVGKIEFFRGKLLGCI